jgi:hypothetical protein
MVAIAIASMLALIPLSADAAAKSSRSKSRAAAASAVQPSPAAGGYYYPAGKGIPPYSHPISRGNVFLDNTAGWGDVGAR